MKEAPPKAPNGFAEFVVLLALCMSLVALAIDAMLPALPDIGEAFAVGRPNTQQFIITALFAGLSLGQLIAGPLSDRLGRKKAMYAGFVVFSAGSLLSFFAQSFTVMLAGRFIQGLGASGPRIITIAMVRDRYAGREMARTMSYIMGVFIFVPALAPAIGQGIIALSEWRMIFLVFVVIAALLSTWMATRLEETLDPADQRPFTVPAIWRGAKEVISNRMTLCYMIAAGCIFGAFVGYLNSSQQIFQDYYAAGDLFALYFGVVALAVGSAFFVNAHFVRRFGMRRIVLWALVAMAVLAAGVAPLEFWWGGHLPLPAFMIFLMGSGFCMGMLFGNFNALAMVPMGHLAGIASAVIGCVSLIISVTAGSVIGQLYQGSLIPVTGGFLVLSLLSLGMMRLAERAPEDDGQKQAA